MEDVLEVYQRPHDPARPVVCIDETTKQLLKETRQPVAMQKGRPRRVDYEYERNGTASIFMIFAPLEGRREALVTDRHTAIDYAHALKHVADEMFPHAEKIVLVQIPWGGGQRPALGQSEVANTDSGDSHASYS